MLYLEFIHGVVSVIPLRYLVSVFHITFRRPTFSVYGKPLPVAALINCPQSSFILGIYYLMFATFAGKLPSSLRNEKNNPPDLNLFTKEVFSSVYGFKPGPGGLAYLGLGIGFFAASFFGAYTADQVYKYVSSLPQLSLLPY